MIKKTGFKIILSLLCILLLYGLGDYLFSIRSSNSHSAPQSKNQPALNVFPLNPTIQFIQKSSTFSLDKMKKNNTYELQLHTQSETTAPAYLRQDFSLIFSNGLLVESLYHWEENSALFEQNSAIYGKDSARYDVITYHHAEIHGSDKRRITSQQTLSQDQVYVLSSAFPASTIFREATTNTQRQWQRILDSAIEEQLDYYREHLVHYYQLNSAEYEWFSLTQVPTYLNVTFPSFSREETEQLIGYIWGVLYQHYSSGGTTPADEEETLVGSSIPFIYLAKDKTHFHILFRTANGAEIKLTQQINP